MEQNRLRRLLRPLYESGRLEARMIFLRVDGINDLNCPENMFESALKVLRKKDLLQGGATIVPQGSGVYALTYPWMRLEVRIKA